MKSPAEFLIGFLFTITSTLFWYGGYAILIIQEVLVRYWWAILAVGASFTVGRYM